MGAAPAITCALPVVLRLRSFYGSGIRYVAGISWPRSGHHLLERLLRAYFGGRFVYCDFYPEDRDCCRAFPCKRAGKVTFTKNHDFDLDLPKAPGVPYLVQYRSFLPSTVSDFDLSVYQGNEDTAESFRQFALMKADRYAVFVRKWTAEPPAPRGLVARCRACLRPRVEQLVVKYDDFVAAPVTHLRRAVRFCAPGEKLDETALVRAVEDVEGQRVTTRGERWVKGLGVQETRRIEDFRFYDPALFEELRERAERA